MFIPLSPGKLKNPWVPMWLIGSVLAAWVQFLAGDLTQAEQVEHFTSCLQVASVLGWELSAVDLNSLLESTNPIHGTSKNPHHSSKRIGKSPCVIYIKIH